MPTSADAISPVTSGDEDKMAAGLNKIREEDPTFELIHQPHLAQTLLATQGEIHTNFILDKLKKQTGVAVERRRPRINFKETIRGTAEKQGRHKKQTGGRGQFGDVHLRLEPHAAGRGLRVRRRDRRRRGAQQVHPRRGEGLPRDPAGGPGGRLRDGRREVRPLLRVLPQRGLERGGLQDGRAQGPQGAPSTRRPTSCGR